MAGDRARPSGPPIGSRPLPRLSPGAALWRGTITALVLVVPAAILNQLLIDAGDIEPLSVFALFFWALILLGGAAGGWAVIRLSPEADLRHAAAAAALAYVLIQTVGAVRRLIDGDEIGWVAYPMLALLMATCGMLGGMLARRWQRSS